MKIATLVFVLVLLYMLLTPADADGVRGPVGHQGPVRRYQQVLVHPAPMRPQPSVTYGHFRQPGRREEAGRMAAAGSRPRNARTPPNPGALVGYVADRTDAVEKYLGQLAVQTTDGTQFFSEYTIGFGANIADGTEDLADGAVGGFGGRRRRKTGYNLRTI